MMGASWGGWRPPGDPVGIVITTKISVQPFGPVPWTASYKFMSLRRRCNVLRNLALYTLEHNPLIAEGRAVLRQPAWMVVMRSMLHRGDTQETARLVGEFFLPLDVGDTVVVWWYDMDLLYGWSTSRNQHGYFSWDAICDIGNLWCDRRSEHILWVPLFNPRDEWQWACVWHRTWCEWAWIRTIDVAYS